MINVIVCQIIDSDISDTECVSVKNVTCEIFQSFQLIPWVLNTLLWFCPSPPAWMAFTPPSPPLPHPPLPPPPPPPQVPLPV